MIRNTSLILLTMVLFSCQKSENAEKKNGFIFNGHDLSDWTIKFANQNLNVNYLNTFRVQDSMIRIAYDQYDSFGDAYAHIYYNKPYSYYKSIHYRLLATKCKGVRIGTSATVA